MYRMGRPWKERSAPGQSMVELALLLPILVILVLGAVDISQVVSVQQRLARAAHLATIKLLVSPTLNLSAFIQAESGLATATASSRYALGQGKTDLVVVTSSYDYPLLMPGLRNLQTGSIGNGKLRITVQTDGIAATSPPTVAQVGALVVVRPPRGPTVPAGLVLICALNRDGLQLVRRFCASSIRVAVTPGAIYTATATQVNGVVSPPSSAVTGT